MTEYRQNKYSKAYSYLECLFKILWYSKFYSYYDTENRYELANLDFPWYTFLKILLQTYQQFQYLVTRFVAYKEVSIDKDRMM